MLCNTLGRRHYGIGPASDPAYMGPSSRNAGGLGCYPTHYFLAARQQISYTMQRVFTAQRTSTNSLQREGRKRKIYVEVNVSYT